MSNHLPRAPVRFIKENHELLKAQAGQRLGTDYRPGEESVLQVAPGVVPSYRVPVERSSGNELFRRYPDGSLDMGYAKAAIVIAIHRAKEGGGIDQLNSIEKVALSVLFPASFDHIQGEMTGAVAAVQLRLSPVEILQLRQSVAAHLSEELNWNAGFGGSSVPGRSSTRA